MNKDYANLIILVQNQANTILQIQQELTALKAASYPGKDFFSFSLEKTYSKILYVQSLWQILEFLFRTKLLQIQQELTALNAASHPGKDFSNIHELHKAITWN